MPAKAVLEDGGISLVTPALNEKSPITSVPGIIAETTSNLKDEGVTVLNVDEEDDGEEDNTPGSDSLSLWYPPLPGNMNVLF